MSMETTNTPRSASMKGRRAQRSRRKEGATAEKNNRQWKKGRIIIYETGRNRHLDLNKKSSKKTRMAY
jgi:hypothetical protein